MSASWKKAQIADLVEPITTVDPRQTPGEVFTYIDVSSVCRETLSIKGEKEILGLEAPSRARRKVMSGDVIFATIRPTLQRLAVIPDSLDDAICSTGFFVLRPKRNLVSRFLFYYLLSKPFMEEMAALQRGASYPAVSDSDIKRHRLPLPLLPEQKRIVEILDEAFEAIDKAIANTERNIRNAEELIRNRVSEIFSEAKLKWPTSTLEEVSGITMGQSPPGISYNSSGNGVPLVNGPVEFGGLHPFSRTVASKFTTKPTKLCQKGDLILCVRGSTTGRMNIAGYDSCIGRGVAAISPKHSQDWIYRYISFIQGEIFALGTGSTFPNISKKSLGSIVIPIPPEGVQQSYYSMLEILDSKCSELIQINRAKLLLLANLKQSILQKAFTGELTKDLRALDKALSEAGV